jgi:segregation and condensation protein B
MADSPNSEGAGANPAEDLSRAYRSLLDREAWEVDVPEGTADGNAVASPSETAAPPPLLRILEALLFVGGDPLTTERAASVIRGLTSEQFSQTLDMLNREYRIQGRPYSIQHKEEGYYLVLRSRYRQISERLYGRTREARLSAAAIDVLSLIAYRQPVTKQEIDSMRGAESGALLRQLVRRGLITIVERGQAGRRDVSYGTTARFLELFKLRSLEDLPQTQDLQKL